MVEIVLRKSGSEVIFIRNRLTNNKNKCGVIVTNFRENYVAKHEEPKQNKSSKHTSLQWQESQTWGEFLDYSHQNCKQVELHITNKMFKCAKSEQNSVWFLGTKAFLKPNQSDMRVWFPSMHWSYRTSAPPENWCHEALLLFTVLMNKLIMKVTAKAINLNDN